MAQEQEKSGGDGRNSPDFVKSLERGLDVIRAFSSDQPKMTLADMAKVAGISRASARRYLYTLETLGYVKTDGKYFWLAPKILMLGYTYLSTQSLRTVSKPHIHDLSARLGESVSVSVLDEESIVYIARASAQQIMRLAITVGTRLPAVQTSMGKVLLSGLTEEEVKSYVQTYASNVPVDCLVQELVHIGQQGYCLSDQVLEAGLRSIAVPIYDRSGNIIAAVNVSTRVGTRQGELTHLKEQILPELRKTGQLISTDYQLTEAS
ncbi:IclR family transcriptional regulator domain-containing protein [Rothia nasimurium]|uniref:IclR family transcriptional regulator domain-containing protein n=1 Tax=Rothia nasimurium TaxID=85336 RepID=UPI003BA28A7F